MVENVKRGEARRGIQVERASYMLTSLDPNPRKAAEVVRDYYFFVYQLAEVVRPEVLAPYGVTEDRLAPMKEAWRKGDLAEAKRLIPTPPSRLSLSREQGRRPPNGCWSTNVQG